VTHPRGFAERASALITGAATGIGRATADLFASQGARLVLADVNAEGLDAVRESLSGSSADVLLVTADVSQPKDARRAIDAAVERFGRIDIAVANAGVIPLASVIEATPEDWDHVRRSTGGACS